MRLLHTSMLNFCEFIGSDDIPSYAILSHTWEEEEVSYYDFFSVESHQMKGYEKIRRCCDLAASEGFEYIWIDTCCIDKKSSAELSEAINSMYNWYRDAAICYVYLADISLITNEVEGLWMDDSEYMMDDSDNSSQEDMSSPSRLAEAPPIGQGSVELKKFVESRWFKRGWTLQELLAPRALQFYDQNWILIGTQRSLADHISTAAGFAFPPTATSIAAKMSWASKRQTTRPEDMAYCLLGLFDVNMPLLYGEGDKAFFRLQQEIIKSSNDHSIFAWTRDDTLFSGILASSPADFKNSADVRPLKIPGLSRTPYSITNLGLEIKLAQIRESKSQSVCRVILCCGKGPSVEESEPVMLELMGKNVGHNEYQGWSRIHSDRLKLLPKAQMAAVAAQAQFYETRLFRIQTFVALRPSRPPFFDGINLTNSTPLAMFKLSPAAQARLAFVKKSPNTSQSLLESEVQYAENDQHVGLEHGQFTIFHYVCAAKDSIFHVVVAVGLNLPGASYLVDLEGIINRIEAHVAVQSNVDVPPVEWLTRYFMPHRDSSHNFGLTFGSGTLVGLIFRPNVHSSSVQEIIGRTLALPMGSEGTLIIKSSAHESPSRQTIIVDIDIGAHDLSSIL